MARDDTLSASVHRLLAVRLGMVAVAACVVFAILAWLTARDRITAEVERLATTEVRLFNQRAQDLLDRPDGIPPAEIQRRLEAFASAARSGDTRNGQFVLVRVFDDSGNVLAELSDDSFPEIQAVAEAVDRAEIDPDTGREHRVLATRLDGAPYVAILLPLVDSRDAVRARLGGVFAVSPEAVARVRAGILRTVLYVVAIVLATALAMYPVITDLLGRLSRMAVNLLDSNLETLQVLGGAIAKRDSDTDAHNYRVSVYAVRLAEVLGLPREQIRQLIKGSLLHDVGKLGIRDDILLKPDRLTEDELAVMKTHVRHGLEITARASWLDDAREVVGAHHEKFDGAGYPEGLRGEDIPVTARIFAIVDVFDALTSRRPYKEPLPFDETMQILNSGRGSHFDPRLLDAFSGIARELYDEFSGHDNDRPKRQLESMTEEYFKRSAADVLA